MHPEGVKLAKHWEGCHLFIYDDLVKPTRPWKVGEKKVGTLTIGIGHALFTEAEIQKYLQGITMEKAEQLFAADMGQSEAFINSLKIKGLSPGSPQHAALSSLHFNCPSAFSPAAGEGTFGKLLVAGNQNFLAWWTAYVYATKKLPNGKKQKVFLPGLLNRRMSELLLYLTGKFLHV